MRKISDLVRDQRPLTLPPSASVMEAACHMRNRGVGAVVVTEGDARLVGIFTGRDAVARVLAEGKNPAETTLVEVMTANPATMTPAHNAIEALRLMQDARCRHVPIVYEGSSVFDFLTFYVLLRIFGAGEVLFHTGWFIESLATQVLVVFAIRTHRPLFRSRPHIFIGTLALGIVGLAVALPFTPVGAWLGFVGPSALFFLYLATASVAYLALVEATKFAFYRVYN